MCVGCVDHYHDGGSYDDDDKFADHDYHGHGNDAGEGRVGRVEELLALQSESQTAFAGPLACPPSPPFSLPSHSASSPLSGGVGGGGGGGCGGVGVVEGRVGGGV